MTRLSGEWVLGILTVSLRTLTLASKFLLVLTLARLLPPSELGLFGIMVAGTGFGIVALGLEFHAFAIRELISANDARRAVMLRNQFIIFIGSCFLVLPLMLIAFALDLMPWQLLVWFYPLLVLEYMSHESTRVLIALSRPFAGNVVLFLRSGAWVYFVLGWIALTRHPTITAVWIGWLIGLLVSIAVAIQAFSKLPWRGALCAPVDWRWIGQGIRTAPPFLITAASALSLMYIDRFFINGYENLSALGIYTFFSGITVAMHTLVHTGVLSLRIPRVVSASRAGDDVKFEHEMAELLKTTTIGALLMAIPACLAIYPLVWIVGHPEYADNIVVFFVLLLGAFIRCIAEVPVYRLYARHQDLYLLAVNAVAFVVIVLGNLLLVPRYGIMGAAVASVVAALALGLNALVVPRAKGAPRLRPGRPGITAPP